MPGARSPSLLGPAALGVMGTLAVILPAFLTGAMAVQIRQDLHLSDADIGLAIGSFFVGSATGSMALGSLAERLGPSTAIRLGLSVTIGADAAIALGVSGLQSLVVVLVVAGLANALTQPAINLLLVRVVAPGRLGLVMALKQSGMPGAALLGGLAVPVVALTVGWRAGYWMAALVALLAMSLSRAARPAPTRAGDRQRPSEPPDRAGARPDLGWRMLLLMAAVGVLGGGAANVLVAYLVSGAVDAGIDPGPAGLLLTFGSALGIASRLAHGWLADRGRFDVLGRVIALFAVGAVGGLLLAFTTPISYLVATPLAFAAGWAWPGLFNLVVVNANRSAPAAATGVTQTGVYVGSLLGPVAAGALIGRSGYSAAWLLTGSSLAGAALLAAWVRAGLRRSGAGDGGPSRPRGGASQVETGSSSR